MPYLTFAPATFKRKGANLAVAKFSGNLGIRAYNRNILNPYSN